MYRPNPGGRDDGPTTVWAQQKARIQEIADESEEVCTIDHRVACLTDFKAWADGMTEQGHKLVVLTDANQSLEDTSESYNLRDWIGNAD